MESEWEPDMAKRGYKLQEFEAHGSNVNCLNIGKKSCRIFITGGEDRIVNLWAIGKPTSLLSLSGHTSSVQSVTFDSAEVLVLAGSANGTIKLWDLEEAKLVRTIAGHRFNCTAVEFHPFGEFFASGSLDTDLKIWDIRKKGCIHTYKGHTRGIRTIKFSPDGRWVVTGGEDHVVKVWDLTAGKLLHDFKFHNGIIWCIDFHPQEFLFATGSADRTVNFWDLETFELIGSAGPEATSMHSMVFHPDGRTLFCGLDETLKVFSWEPIRCHDSVEMGWSTLGDLGIYEGKLLGCSYHQRRVGVWVADISQIGPYGVGVKPKNNTEVEPVNNYCEDQSVDQKEICTDFTMKMFAPDSGAKNNDTERGYAMQSNVCRQSVIQEDPIYSSNAEQLNSTGFRSNNPSMSCHSAPQKPNSRCPSKVSTLNTSPFRVSKARQVAPSTPNGTAPSLASRDIPQSSSKLGANTSLALKKSPMTDLDTVKNKLMSKPVSTPILVPKESLDSERMSGSRKVNTLTETLSRSTAFQKFNRMQQPLFSSDISDSQVYPSASRPSSSSADELRGRDSSLVFRLTGNDETVIADEPDSRGIRKVAKKFERIMSLEQPVGLQDNIGAVTEPPVSSTETSSVKYVRGVAVQLGRTRSLVESWEKRERSTSSQTDPVSSVSDQAPQPSNLPTVSDEEVHTKAMETKADDDFDCEILLQGHDVFLNTVKYRLTKLQVIRHFWQRSGFKGAIDAVVKLPDLSIQVDVISVLIEKIDLFTLDIFSCLLPLLSGLLSSKTDRHATVSLELLLELIKIFGPVIFSTVSASSLVGVDLQAEQRLERCKQCYIHLQKIQKVLPLLIRKGGLLAKQAVKLNLTLSEF